MLLAGCQSTPQADALSSQQLADISQQKQIENVPFYPQQQYYCGPTTLAEVFNYYGSSLTADDIAPALFIPEKDGSLQLEMVTATRQYGFLPYTETSSLSQIMRFLDDDIPVIVFQNLSVDLFPQWHYAVVKGYNLPTRQFTLHTGVTPNHVMSFELFERTWGRADYWLLAPLPPGKTSPYMESFKYISASFDLLQVGQTESAIQNLISATNQWPNNWLSYFLLANHYLNSEPNKSVKWFNQGFHAGQHHSEFLNNYSIALHKVGCHEKAFDMLRQGLLQFSGNQQLQQTLQELKSKISEKPQCTI